MAHKLRVEYPGAIHHVMNRGDRREFLLHSQLTSLALWCSCFVVNAIAVRCAVGRQRHRSTYAEHAPGGVAASKDLLTAEKMGQNGKETVKFSARQERGHSALRVPRSSIVKPLRHIILALSSVILLPATGSLPARAQDLPPKPAKTRQKPPWKVRQSIIPAA
jgi:hypothetical protein